MAKEFTDILKAAAVVRDENVADEYRNPRGWRTDWSRPIRGRAVFSAGMTAKTSATGVSLLIKYHNAEGQTYINELPLPLLNKEQAGVATPCYKIC